MSEPPSERLDELIVRMDERGALAQIRERLGAGEDPAALVEECRTGMERVGRLYEEGTYFISALIMAGEIIREATELLIPRLTAVRQETGGGKMVIATVRGDIHDIGKNIVKMLLENYGYTVIDLGRDAPPEAIVAAVKEKGVRLVGLSALMTTTVRAMEETIQMLHREVPDCKIMVGGAVLNPEYAKMVGADFYGKDAAESARIAERFFSE